MHQPSIKKCIMMILVALVIISTLQVDIVEAGQKSDILFVKGKFIKKDKKGTIVVDEKSHCGCHHRRK